jgi:hypothetical protein
MEEWEINGNILEYDDTTHTYLVNGVIVPSVTQVMQVKFGNKYEGIRSEVLNRAAERGTTIHKAIENYCKGMDDGSKEVHNFNFLMNYYKIKPVKNEVPIILMVDNQPVIAGRLDLVLQENDTLSLADIKTTSQLDKEYLAYQLNLYRLGYMQSYGERIDKLYGLHLRGDKRKLVELPINEDIALELLEKYERSKNNE